MSKNSKRDIKGISDGLEAESMVTKKRSRSALEKSTGIAGRRKSTKTSVALTDNTNSIIEQSGQSGLDAMVQNSTQTAKLDDHELEKLLLQVDHMLTEMTQSKWLSSDWPSLEIDFGSDKK